MTAHIRPLQATDIPQLVSLWQSAVHADPVNEHRLITDYVLDPHYDQRWVQIAAQGSDVLGFVFGMRARQDRHSDNDPHDGIIVAFGVRSDARGKGIGAELLNALESAWRADGVTRIQVGPWVPTYLAPGVDEAAYPEAVPFLERLGYKAGGQPVSMRALLTGYRPADGIEETMDAIATDAVVVRPATVCDIADTVEFAQRHFPHWVSYVQDTYRAATNKKQSTIHIALRGKEVIGFALTNGERFGPFGVDESCRGKGIGAVLLSRALCAMRASNVHVAYFMWTSDRTARLYQRHGFEIVRRFTMVSKSLV